MGKRYEKSKKDVSENRKTLERLSDEGSTLRDEYAPLSLLDSIQGLLDDEASEAIDSVRSVGEAESQRIETDTNVAEDERREIADEINGEIAKLSTGLEKLKQTASIEFGAKSVKRSSQEYQRQIEKFRSLVGELGEQTSEGGAISSTGADFSYHSVGEGEEDAPTDLLENERIDIPHAEFDGLTTSTIPPARGSAVFVDIVGALNSSNIDYRPIEPFQGERSPEAIVARLSGGDLTEGSCSSLALAYVGNAAGYDVLDFRDGESRAYFSSRDSIQKISDLPGVESTTLRGTDDIESANQLLSGMENGKEYYLATGQHASIVRRNGERVEYLELQHPSNGNGWNALDNAILQARFGCRSHHLFAYSNHLISVDSLADNREFLSILGYINTANSEQRKGRSGNVR